eukprot:TRINITY_DN80512_c0_g1_i1.p1 TRINITY_DN80512_c0_g1~~TRINITY_DN80512_c0_g1_i1.p1  ORF type:complete len:328 (-),score=35.92 TRINITY_DN80512_c0_g1_i1:86-1069(-)
MGSQVAAMNLSSEAWTCAQMVSKPMGTQPSRSSSLGRGFFRTTPSTCSSMPRSSQPEAGKMIPERGWPQGKRIIFVRHAQAECRACRSKAGTAANPRLSRHGVAQAERVAQSLLDLIGNADYELVCSPMERCLKTAAPLLLKTRCASKLHRACRCVFAVCNAEFCEHGHDPAHFDKDGICDGHPRTFGDKAPHEVDFDGFGPCQQQQCVRTAACSFRRKCLDTERRAQQAAEWLRAFAWEQPHRLVLPENVDGSHCVVVVAHQTFLDCLLQELLEGTTSKFEYGSPLYKFDNTGITEVATTVAGGGLSLVRNNETKHLAGGPRARLG